MRVLLASGGGWYGAALVPAAQAIRQEGRAYDLRLGVSTGSFLVAADATEGKLEVLRRIYESVDDRDIEKGIKGFISPSWGILGAGLFSFDPLRHTLKPHLDPAKITSPVGFGYVVRETGAYETAVYCPPTTPKATVALLRRAFGEPPVDYQDAMFASAAPAGILNPVVVRVVDREGSLIRRTLSDGSHLHPIPRIPPKLLERVTEVDAILHRPLDGAAASTRGEGAWEAFRWAIELAMDGAFRADVEWLRSLPKRGIPVRVWAPREARGGILSAKRADVLPRLQEILEPIILPAT